MDRWGRDQKTSVAPTYQSSIPRPLGVFVAILIVALLTSLGFLARALFENYVWKMEVENLAWYRGVTHARRDFEAGRLRLFVIAGERRGDVFSGTNDGPFGVWFPQYSPDAYPMRYSTEQLVEAYNQRMRYMQAHPERYLPGTNAVTPKGTDPR